MERSGNGLKYLTFKCKIDLKLALMTHDLAIHLNDINMCAYFHEHPSKCIGDIERKRKMLLADRQQDRQTKGIPITLLPVCGRR